MADEKYPKRTYGTYEIDENLSLKENLAAAKAAGALILKADLDRYEEWIAKLDARKPAWADVTGKPTIPTMPTADTLSGATTVGKQVIKAKDAATARTAIGAGTSDLAIGTTATTAKAGDYKPKIADISDAPAVGQNIMKAASQGAARTAILAVSQADFDALVARVKTLEDAATE